MSILGSIDSAVSSVTSGFISVKQYDKKKADLANNEAQNQAKAKLEMDMQMELLKTLKLQNKQLRIQIKQDKIKLAQMEAENNG